MERAVWRGAGTHLESLQGVGMGWWLYWWPLVEAGCAGTLTITDTMGLGWGNSGCLAWQNERGLIGARSTEPVGILRYWCHLGEEWQPSADQEVWFRGRVVRGTM